MNIRRREQAAWCWACDRLRGGLPGDDFDEQFFFELTIVGDTIALIEDGEDDRAVRGVDDAREARHPAVNFGGQRARLSDDGSVQIRPDETAAQRPRIVAHDRQDVCRLKPVSFRFLDQRANHREHAARSLTIMLAASDGADADLSLRKLQLLDQISFDGARPTNQRADFLGD